eukprot:TRINITY_DN6203_c0_g1_i1.p1 TRINITY_DN6203_c0_g1~~TRINITY_DN6203_c0_g1_i1.p1  ORF type:complete len:696 (-),score=141.20 TRINITY_DN6203_c0_g1_i1:57-2144(-)
MIKLQAGVDRLAGVIGSSSGPELLATTSETPENAAGGPDADDLQVPQGDAATRAKRQRERPPELHLKGEAVRARIARGGDDDPVSCGLGKALADGGPAGLVGVTIWCQVDGVWREGEIRSFRSGTQQYEVVFDDRSELLKFSLEELRDQALPSCHAHTACVVHTITESSITVQELAESLKLIDPRILLTLNQHRWQHTGLTLDSSLIQGSCLAVPKPDLATTPTHSPSNKRSLEQPVVNLRSPKKACYIVVGAGSQTVNGEFSRAGESDGVSRFSNGTAWLQRSRGEDGKACWSLQDTQKQLLYSCTSPELNELGIPPSEQWEHRAGLAPPPVVLQQDSVGLRDLGKDEPKPAVPVLSSPKGKKKRKSELGSSATSPKNAKSQGAVISDKQILALFNQAKPASAQEAWKHVCLHAATQSLGLVLSSHASSLFDQWQRKKPAVKSPRVEARNTTKQSAGVCSPVYKLSSCFHCRQTKKSVPTRVYLSCAEDDCPNCWCNKCFALDDQQGSRCPPCRSLTCCVGDNCPKCRRMLNLPAQSKTAKPTVARSPKAEPKPKVSKKPVVQEEPDSSDSDGSRRGAEALLQHMVPVRESGVLQETPAGKQSAGMSTPAATQPGSEAGAGQDTQPTMAKTRNRAKWSNWEDTVVMKWVEQHGAKQWSRLARTMLMTRTGKQCCLLYTSPSPRDRTRSRMPSSA